jgi:ubiquitin-like protein Pup
VLLSVPPTSVGAAPIVSVLNRSPASEVPMATRETGGGQSKSTRRQEEAEEAQVVEEEATDVRERHEKLSEDVDAILDEIDEVLEENAEEFVRQYVQKGGQ